MIDGAEGEREKSAVALSSVVAAVFLTVFKLVVGLLTNSLGILSEAAHSGLDLVAALVTFLAVRVSGRPADSAHHYGHGKVENLSALVETLLLLVTCLWIYYEAIGRLLFKEAEVEANIWAFAVMAVSIVVDIGRSQVLSRAAQKHHSQALEADALHFSTDIWSSSVVIVGLALVRLAHVLPNHRSWLVRADTVAALGVASIVVWVSIRLGKRTVDALLDRAPEGLDSRILAALARVPQVQGCSDLRLRTSGPILFVEATVQVSPDLPAGLAHEVATRVEEAVEGACGPCDVTVHVEPLGAEEEDVRGQVRGLAAERGQAVHDLRLHRLEDGYHLELDLEVPKGLSLGEAHRAALAFEEELEAQVADIAGVETHIEVAPPLAEGRGKEVTASYEELIRKVREAVRAQNGFAECHQVRVREVEGDLYISLHCTCPGGLSMEEAHRRSSQLEGQLREALPEVAHFLVHVEPAEGIAPPRGTIP